MLAVDMHRMASPGRDIDKALPYLNKLHDPMTCDQPQLKQPSTHRIFPSKPCMGFSAGGHESQRLKAGPSQSYPHSRIYVRPALRPHPPTEGGPTYAAELRTHNKDKGLRGSREC